MLKMANNKDKYLHHSWECTSHTLKLLSDLFSALSSSLVTEILHSSSSYNFFELSSFMPRKQAQWELRSSLNTSGTCSQLILKNRQRFLLEVQPYNSSKHDADKMGSLSKQCVVLMGDAHKTSQITACCL